METIYDLLNKTEDRNNFKIEPLDYVYQKYQEWIKTGKYPYLDSVRKFIKEELTDLTPDQDDMLYHHIYLASNKYRDEQEKIRQEEMISKGWIPLTLKNLESFIDNQKILLSRIGESILGSSYSEKPYRVWHNHEGKTFFMPKGARTRGYYASNFLLGMGSSHQTFFKYL